jgi:carbonic anhydrase
MTTTQDAEHQAAMTPQRALETLKAGNERFLASEGLERDLRLQVQATRAGQWPFGVVLSCIDSRVPAELVFDCGIGDVFNVRVAGNFVNTDILGSMEFACAVAGARLVVVLGHTHCGAIKGACDDVQLGNLTSLLANLKPAVDQVPEADPERRSSATPSFVQAVADRNVELTVAAIREQSPVLRELEVAGTIQIVGAMYDVETGGVEFST